MVSLNFVQSLLKEKKNKKNNTKQNNKLIIKIDSMILPDLVGRVISPSYCFPKNSFESSTEGLI